MGTLGHRGRFGSEVGYLKNIFAEKSVCNYFRYARMVFKNTRGIYKFCFDSLQILSLGGNQILEVPETVGHLTGLQALVLSDNLLEQLPASIANLNQLRSLLIHKNRLKTLPTQIIKLKCLTEVSDIKNNY